MLINETQLGTEFSRRSFVLRAIRTEKSLPPAVPALASNGRYLHTRALRCELFSHPFEKYMVMLTFCLALGFSYSWF